jgi:hypothetical protein
VLIARSLERYRVIAIEKAHTRIVVKVAHNREAKMMPRERVPRALDRAQRRRADELEVLRVANGEWPVIMAKTGREGKPVDMNGRAQAVELGNALDFTKEAIADVAANPHASLDQDLPRPELWRWIQLRSNPGWFSVPSWTLASLEHLKAGGRTA